MRAYGDSDLAEHQLLNQLSDGIPMHKRMWFTTLCLGVALGSVIPSYVGLVNQNRILSLVGFIGFVLAILVFSTGLYFIAGKTEAFWFARFLSSLGSFGLLSTVKFDVEPYIEGSLVFSLFINLLFHYAEYFSGAGSYMYTSITSLVWYFLLEALMMSAVARYGIAFHNMSNVAELCENSTAQAKHKERVERAEGTMTGTLSFAVFVMGAILSLIVYAYINTRDHLYEQTVFYVTQQYNGPIFNVFVLEPSDVLGLISWHLVTAIVTGLLTVGALMTVVTLQFLTQISSSSNTAEMALNPFNPLPVKRVTETLTSFWFMTSSGLLILPLLAVIASALKAAGRTGSAELNFMTVYYYPVFLVSFFITSSFYVRRFISSLKFEAERRIGNAVRDAQDDALKVKDLALELFLIDRVPEGPAGGIFMQLFQVAITIGLALLSLHRG